VLGVRFARSISAALLVALTLCIAAGSAAAHVCPVAAIIPVGAPSNVTVAVTVEAVPVTEVDVEVPQQLRIDRVQPFAGWKITQSGQTIHYKGVSGTQIPAFTCQYFAVELTALTKGAYALPVTQRDAKGNVVARTSISGDQKVNPYFEQTVYAGEKPPAPPGKSISLTVVAGGVLIAFGVIMLGTLAFRSWRARKRAARDDELADRLDVFKKQTRDRSQEPS